MRKVWNVKTYNSGIQEKLSQSLRISPILARILATRNVFDANEARNFLYGNMSFCHDPFLLKNMGKAVEGINAALCQREKIMIYGDYDVDGITSVALLKLVLDELGADSITYIPNRLEEGYGLNAKAVKFAHHRNIKLIITADCGIGAVEEVNLANSLGIKVIVTDHHEIKREDSPSAFAIINPHQPDCQYPFKYLAGVGVVYKLTQALMKKRFYNLERHLDLVALGTVADVAPQKGENRIFTRYGISVLNNTDKIGLKSLISFSGLAKKQISASHIGYILGPRINAMGRIGSPDVALRLLLTDNKLEADKLAKVLNKENSNRQKIEAKILSEAILKAEREINFKDHRVIVLAKEGWHPGVIGIVASRIQDRYYRPTIMIALKGNTGKGSGRSIDGFHLFNALIFSEDCLLNFGGHEAACGLSIHTENIDKFRDKINGYARDNILDKDLSPRLSIDVDMPLSSLSQELITELNMLEPYGPGNPRPIFVSSGISVRGEPRFIGRNGVKMWVGTEGIACEAISFKRDTIDIPAPGQILDIAYSPSINTWQGIESIQLDLRDVRIG